MPVPVDPIDRRAIAAGLSAAVYEYAINAEARHGPLARVWVFVSEGLGLIGQREIVVGVRREQHEDRARYPQFPLWLFQIAARYARDGSIVESGGRTILGSPDSDVDARLAGFVYSDHPQCLSQLPAAVLGGKREPLIAVPLLSGEAQAAEYVGQARVLSLLAHQARRYPFPWWFEPGREPVINASSDVGPSILSGVDVSSAPYLEVGKRGAQLEIMIRQDDCEQLHETLKDGPRVVGLLPRISHTGHSQLYWQPGQQEERANWNETRSTAEISNTLIGGNFLLLTHGEFDTTATVLEDGFAVILSELLWTQLLAAIAERRPFRARIAGPTIDELILQFAMTALVSPFGEYRTTSGSFVRHVGAAGRSEKPPLLNVDLDKTVLLSGHQETAAAIDAENLASFIDDVWAVVDDALDGIGSDWDHLVLNFHITPADGVNARLAVRGNVLPEALFERLVNRVNALSTPAGLRSEIQLELWMKPTG